MSFYAYLVTGASHAYLDKRTRNLVPAQYGKLALVDVVRRDFTCLVDS